MLREYRTVVVVDHHKRSSVYQILETETGEVTSGKIKGNRLAMRHFLERLERPATVYIEACRGWEWVSDLCEDVGIDCRLVNPAKMPEIWRSTKKTDRHDVDAMLSRLLGAGSLPESYRATRAQRELRELTRTRLDIQKQRRQTLNRLHALSDSQGLPASQREFSESQWRTQMSVELGEHFALALGVWLDLLDHLTDSLARLDARITELTADREDVKRLQQMPGVGPVLSATIVAETGSVDRFKDSRHFASYSGLVPRVRSSAGKAKLGRLTKTGPPALRWAFTQAIVAGMRVRGNPFVRFCRKKRRRGERAMRSICAAAHKLARVIFVMLSRGIDYDPQKVGRI